MTAVLVFRCMLAKDSYPCYPLSVCKGLLSLFSGFRLHRIAVLVSAFCLQKDCGPCFLLYDCKDYGPCLLLFICKGLWSLSSAFCDCGPCFRFSFAKDFVLPLFVCKGLCPCFCYPFAKDCNPCFRFQFTRSAVIVFAIHLQRTASLLPLSVCKGLMSSSFAIHLQRTTVLVLCS